MASEAFRLYSVTDEFLEAVGDELITPSTRLNGILLRPSVAAWFVSNGLLTDYTGDDAGPRPVRPVEQVPLNKLFAPVLTPSDDGKKFVFRAVSGKLTIVEFKPADYEPPGDPGDLALYFTQLINLGA